MFKDRKAPGPHALNSELYQIRGTRPLKPLISVN